MMSECTLQGLIFLGFIGVMALGMIGLTTMTIGMLIKEISEFIDWREKRNNERNLKKEKCIREKIDEINRMFPPAMSDEKMKLLFDLLSKSLKATRKKWL